MGAASIPLGEPCDRSPDPDPEKLVARLPRSLWIELTSKCPFDCVFCSRSTLRGAGEHMSFALYRSLIAQLREPEVIRLNYSGESTHHPRIIEAIELAAATGASVELVTALASLPHRLIGPLVESGLGRLSISLHTMDAAQFSAIYRHASFDALRERLEALGHMREQRNDGRPWLDLAFVAMRRNIDQLPAIADWAASLGISPLVVHPVIRRDPIPETFEEELAGARLRGDFLADLAESAGVARARNPGLQLVVSTPESEAAPHLDHRPRPYAPPLPDAARIHGCEQNPWETLHVLANGDVVVCEVQDTSPVGNLVGQSLAEIWQGAAYGAIRAGYARGESKACRACAYKSVHRAASLEPAVWAGDGSGQLLRGWNAWDAGEPDRVYAKRDALLRLGRPPGAALLRLVGRLDPGERGQNRLEIRCDDLLVGAIDNPGAKAIEVDLSLRLAEPELAGAPSRGEVWIRLTTRDPRMPFGRDRAGDARERGFGLRRIELRDD